MERLGRNIPDARPLYRAAFFPGELAALFLGLGIKISQYGGIQISLIERRLAAADHRRHDARKRFDAAHGTYRIRIFLCDAADLERKFGRGSQRVAPRTHRRGTGVCLFPMKRNRVPLHTLRAQHYAERQVHALKNRPLLNVEFKVSRRVDPLLACFADSLNVYAASSKRLVQAYALRIRPSAILRNGLRARKC